jgi:hypothetical protein
MTPHAEAIATGAMVAVTTFCGGLLFMQRAGWRPRRWMLTPKGLVIGGLILCYKAYDLCTAFEVGWSALRASYRDSQGRRHEPPAVPVSVDHEGLADVEVLKTMGIRG